MNKKELIEKIKSNPTKVAVVGGGLFVGFVLMTAISNRQQLNEALDRVEYKDAIIRVMEEDLEEAEGSLLKAQEMIISLEEKVESAKPFFDMEASKQQELEEQVAREEEEKLAREEEERLLALQEEIDAKTIELSNGNFVAGIDFESGTYDVVAVKGNGNVSSDNMYSGGLNAIMGVSSNEMYEKEYKNIKLPSGTTLKISGVTIKLVPKN